jgi:putative hydrolase of HD superfamily
MTLFQFLTICDSLKWIPRTGWLLRGVPLSSAENVAAHSHTTALLAYLLALQSKEPVDIQQLLVMALIHDIPEAEIGDIPISAQRADPSFRGAKEKAEDNAMQTILAHLPSQLQSALMETWTAYRKGTSLEVRLVETADRLATALHAAQLVKTGYPTEAFQTFIDHAESTVTQLQIPQAEDFITELQKIFTAKSEKGKGA